MAILDATLIGELTAIITTTMQAIKSHPKIQGSAIPWLSGVVGAASGIGWFLVSGDLDDGQGFLNVDWADAFRGVVNGIAGAVTANGAYNIQKFLPIPNVLPTAGELDEHKLKEQIKTQERVVEAVEAGVAPETAKEAVGLEPEDPPPAAALEEVAPTPEENVAEKAADTEELAG